MLENRSGPTQVIRDGLSAAIKHCRLGKERFMQTKQTSSPELKTVAAQCSRDPFQEVLAEAAARAHRYLRTFGERRVGVTQKAIGRLPALGGTLPSQGQDPKSVLRLLDEIGSPATIAGTGGRLFGGVIGGALPTTVAAHWLAGAWDQNACLFDFSPLS